MIKENLTKIETIQHHTEFKDMAFVSEPDSNLAEICDFVKASYQVLLRRNPDPGSYETALNKLAQGKISYAAHLRAMSKSREFSSKWKAVEPSAQVDQTKLIESTKLRVPDDLTVSSLVPKRVLIIGSCLSEAIQVRMKEPPISCESELYFAGGELPEAPEHNFVEYDFQIVQLPLRTFLPDGAFARLSHLDEAAHEELFLQACNSVRHRLERSMKWNSDYGLLTFVFPFVEPMQNPVGRLLPAYDLRNPVYFVRRLNELLAGEIAAYPNSYMFDLNGILSFHGRRFFQDDLLAVMAHGAFLTDFDSKFDTGRLEPAAKFTDFFECKISEGYQIIWQELVGLYRTVRQTDQVKMVVIDLDDTLWRGVIGELPDIDNLPTSEGWPKSFWEALLIIKRRGILLGIISKNDEEKVVEAWPRILGRVLRLEDFVIRKINWNPKAENMGEILNYVNLLPRNVLYIDDNPVERAAVNSVFPEIRTLGGSPLLWRRILLWAPETQLATITRESAARTEMVRAQVVREEQRQVMPRSEFLASLNVTMNMFAVDGIEHPRFARALELINKTNQFNTTGRRWSLEDCKKAFAAGMMFHAFEVEDLYTEYGLVGVLCVDECGIQQFVMSCRVLGLEVEIAAVAEIVRILRTRNQFEIFAMMVETDRNQPCRNVYAQCGFTRVTGGWQLVSDKWFSMPAHIKLINSLEE